MLSLNSQHGQTLMPGPKLLSLDLQNLGVEMTNIEWNGTQTQWMSEQYMETIFIIYVIMQNMIGQLVH